MRPCFETQRASSEQQRSKGGFPIRRFTDQSLFAAPRDLSQRTTSFIASQRQGIHQIPLRHLIALIAKARLFISPRSAIEGRTRVSGKDQFCFKRIRGSERSGSKPTTGCSGSDNGDRTTDDGKGPCVPNRLAPSLREKALSSQLPPRHPALDRMRFLFTMSDIERSQPERAINLPINASRKTQRAGRETKLISRIGSGQGPGRSGSDPAPASRDWWSQTGSNRRPHACKARALPTELWPRNQPDQRVRARKATARRARRRAQPAGA